MTIRRTAATQFAVCIDNTDYPVSLETGKVYQVLRDVKTAKLGYMRVIDESGEDYLYSAQRFLVLELPDTTARRLRRQLSTMPRSTPKPVRALRRRRA